MISQLKTLLLVYLSTAMIVIGIPTLGYTMTVPTELSVPSMMEPSLSDAPAVQRALESRLLSQRLIDLGLSPAEVQAKVSSLTNEQLHQVAQQLDSVQTGGELILILAIVGAVVLVLAIIGLIHGHGHHY